MIGADLLARELLRHGTDHLFTLCGNGLDQILIACRAAGIRVVDTRNEQAAGYMADAYGRLTGKVGVGAASTGVAHVNALTGMCNAWFDGAPMLLVTGATDSATRGRGNFQDMDSVGLTRPFTKFADWVDRAERIPWAVEQAFSAAVAGRPGPVHLTIPADILRAEVAAPPVPLTGPVNVGNRAATWPDESDVDQAVDLIAHAERPVILAGSGVFYAGAQAGLANLAAELHAPVLVPIWDRGAVERPIPEFVGVVGAASGGPRVLPDADLVLMLGARVDYRVGYLEPPAIAPDAVVIRMDADPAELNQGARPAFGLLGMAPEALAGWVRAMRGRPDTAPWLAECQRRDREFRRRWIEAPAPPAPPMTGRHVTDVVQRVVTDDTVLLVDGGNIGQWFHMAMCDRYPARWLTCGASAVVGWGIPAAGAARAAYPEAPILLVSGDGASTFTIAELECHARQRLPYVCVIADDQAWGIVISGHKRRRSDAVGAELGAIDFAKVAEGFGAIGRRAETPEELEAAIRDGFQADRPVMIHAPIALGGPADEAA
ncbi:MAG: thiamine pyrophosphate-binding protein [Armatimonadetes bacterium]|nr:thiamine pyrophosphate-binding protein [Armatimonadota bacterium]